MESGNRELWRVGPGSGDADGRLVTGHWWPRRLKSVRIIEEVELLGLAKLTKI